MSEGSSAEKWSALIPSYVHILLKQLGCLPRYAERVDSSPNNKVCNGLHSLIDKTDID